MKPLSIYILFSCCLGILPGSSARAALCASPFQPGNQVRRDTVIMPSETPSPPAARDTAKSDTAAGIKPVQAPLPAATGPAGSVARPLPAKTPAIKKTNYYQGKNYTFGGHLGLSSARAINSSGDIISSPVTGFTAGIFLQHGFNLFGGRTELNYSRMGFTYRNNGSTGQILNDYLSLATLATLTIRHRVQFQLGTQEGYLLSSKDSNGPGTSGENPITAFNRIDFGLTGGLEVFPYTGFTIGLRYNLGLTNLIKRQDNSAASYIPFLQQANGFSVRNGVLQLLIGYQLPL